jgi:hypothetical protein
MPIPTTIVAAGPEGILWLIIAIIYLVVQGIASRKSKGKRPAPPGRSRPAAPQPMGPSEPEAERPIEDQLREFLETLGQPSDVFELPKPPELREEPPEVVAPPPLRPARRRAREARAPASTPALPTRAASFTGPQPIEALGVVETVTTVSTISAISAESSTRMISTSPLLSSRAFQVDLKGLRMPMQRIPTGLRRAGEGGGESLDLHQRANLRKALLHQFILGKPRAAFEEWQEF